MATTPITTRGDAGRPAPRRPALVSPRLITLAYTSWANDADAVIVRPATTARIVANATAEMMPEQDLAAELVGQQRGGRVRAAGRGGDPLGSAPTSAAAP